MLEAGFKLRSFWLQFLWSFLYSVVGTSDRIQEIKMSKQFRKAFIVHFKHLGFQWQWEFLKFPLEDVGPMLRSRVRTEGADSRTTGSGWRGWDRYRQREGKGRDLGLGNVTFLALFKWSRLDGHWRSFSALSHFASEEIEKWEVTCICSQ